MNDGRFTYGNNAHEKWNLEDSKELFLKALKYANDDNDCLCIQDAIYYIKLPSSTFYNLIKRFSELDDIKRDINDSIIRRINKGALKTTFNTTASIWRMKQLGESETINTDVTSNGKDVSTPIINFVKKDTE